MRCLRSIIGFLCISLILSFSATAASAEQKAKEIPLQFSSNCLLIRVQVKDNYRLFLIDTGASRSVIDASLVSIPADASTERIITSLGTRADIPFVRVQGVVADQKLESYGLIGVVDLSQVRELSGEEIYGILGMNFLKHFVLVCSTSHNRYYLLPSLTLNANSAKFAKSKLTWENDVPYIQISGIDGALSVMVDTGFDGSLEVPQTLFNRLASSADGSRSATTAMGALLDTRIVPIILSDSFQWGNTFPKGLAVSASPTSRALLGVKFLSRYNVIFNFPSSEVFYLPNRNFGSVDILDRSGIGIVKVDGRMVVSIIRPNTLASSIDIKPGDIIDKINGKAAAAMSLTEVRDYLALLSSWNQMELILKRGATDVRISVKARPSAP